MNKTEQILILEKFYGITLSNYNSDHSFLSTQNRNTYMLNANFEIIGLNLSYNNITDLSILKDLTSIQYLQLKSNEIKDIQHLENLTSIISLDLSFNFVLDYSILEKLITLKTLNLDRCRIKDVSFIKNLRTIKSLNLSGNEISDISYLKNLKLLSKLNLSDNPIDNFTFIEELKRLHTLIISKIKINNYSFLEKLNNLSKLDISNNEIKDYSFLNYQGKLKSLNVSYNKILDASFLANLNNLVSLNLSNNEIYELKFLESFSKIEILILGSNKITDISYLKNLISLKSLILDENAISDISPLVNLHKITNLNLSENLLSEIDPLKYLKHLETLELRNNQISNISALENLVLIKSLLISNNEISDLAPLKKLKRLQFLFSWSNNIVNIDQLQGLENLTHLDLSSNQITDISSIKFLSSIKTLFLDRNRISNISSLKNLPHITLLELSNNKVSDFRPLEKLLKSVQVRFNEDPYDNDDGIYVYNNFSTIPPVEVIEQGNETILQYFEDAKKYDLKALNECKLIFVGDGGLGKTSLMKKIVGLPFTHETTTHGINKKSWNDVINRKGENIKVNLWDFGGQHIQHSLHQFFLTEKVIYILLLDPRNDVNAMYWLEQIDKLGKDSEVLIVYNYKDPKDKDSHNNKNFFELRKTYPKLKMPYLLSCKDHYGFDLFKKDLIKSILNQKDLLVQYPLNWFKIKDELEKDVTIKKNYIAYNEYDSICKNNNYNYEINKKNLLKQLDKIGSIVFFDKPILNDLQVLNPDWITTGAYSVLTSEITRNKKGHLDYNDLKEMFREEKSLFANERIKLKYQEKDFQFILALMIDYDLCVINPFKQNEYLVPCAFEGEKPKEFEKYKINSRRYRFQFDSSFEMLIMYRFMARNISNCIKNGYWQSGIVIKDQHSSTFSLVETNQHSKIIDFWIQGDNIRGLWEVLRRDIKDIISKYSLTYKEEVLYDSKEGKEVFLSYDEMIDSLKNGKKNISYHPTHRISNIDVLKVIDNFEDSQKIVNIMNKEGQIFNVNGDFITNGNTQIGGKNNTQNSYINTYSNSEKIQELKDILEDLEDISTDNKEWQENFCNALKELYRLEQANDEIDEKKSISKLQKFFTKAKEVKDWVAIGVLPAEIATKGAKMIDLCENLFNFIVK